VVGLVAAVAALLLLPHPVVADDRPEGSGEPQGGAPVHRDELTRTRERLGEVETVLRDARADAGAVAQALAAADRAVARSRARLATATAELDRARQRRTEAMAALEAASDEEDRQERRLAEQVRGAYMTGRVTGLAMLVEAGDLRDLVERAVTLSYVISADQDALKGLEVARKRAVQLHLGMVKAEQARSAAEARVRGELAEIERVRALRRQAKDKLDARVARLAGAAGALRRRSAELRRLIRQEELARQRAGGAGRGSILGPGPPCDLSGTSPAEHWIIMKESSGYPTADNPASTAFGLGQLLLGNRILYLGQAYATTDCARQLWAFRSYVRDRYGTAERAKAFWQANGWY
jgi:septal ring factor EnvC (AmiA/AmiB activator)